MQRLIFIFLFIGIAAHSQNQVKAVLKDSTALKAKTIFGVDTFGTMYYATNNNTFNKKAKDTTITYANFQLGEITTANTFNPLKINLFYKDFNTVIILDNRLAEVYKIDFNTLQNYKNVSFVSTGYDNTLWIFNQDLQQLECLETKTADYLGVSPVFKTDTKTDTIIEWGLSGIEKIRSLTNKALVAIGNMNIENASNLYDCLASIS